MDTITLIGLVAGTLTTISFLPQVHKIWKTRQARDVSILMYLAFAAGVALWVLYGFATHALPVIVANSITLLLAIWIIVMKVRFERRDREEE